MAICALGDLRSTSSNTLRKALGVTSASTHRTFRATYIRCSETCADLAPNIGCTKISKIL